MSVLRSSAGRRRPRRLRKRHLLLVKVGRTRPKCRPRSWSHSLPRKSRSLATSLSIETALSDATSLPWRTYKGLAPTACALNELDASTNGRFRNPPALSSVLAALGTLQLRAVGFLNRVDPLVSASNYYLEELDAYIMGVFTF